MYNVSLPIAILIWSAAILVLGAVLYILCVILYFAVIVEVQIWWSKLKRKRY